MAELAQRVPISAICKCMQRNCDANIFGKLLLSLEPSLLPAGSELLSKITSFDAEDGISFEPLDPELMQCMWRVSLAPEAGTSPWLRAATEACASCGFTSSQELLKTAVTFVVASRSVAFDERVGITIDLVAHSKTFHVHMLGETQRPNGSFQDYSRVASGGPYQDEDSTPTPGVVAGLRQRYKEIVCTQLSCRGIVIGRNEERLDDVACALLQLAADTEYLGVKWEAVSLTCAEQCASARATVCIVLVLCSCHDRIINSMHCVVT